MASAAAQQPHTDAELFLFQAVNSARAAAGLPALAWHEGLFRAAAAHVDSMRQRDELSHQFEGEADIPERVAGSGVRFTAVSENVAVAESPAELHRAWMESPDHRENILDPQMNAIGISLSGNPGELWAVEEFARVQDVLLPEQQEQRVAELLRAAGLTSVQEGHAARDACAGGAGVSGGRTAAVVRFTSSDLSRLPAQLALRIAQEIAQKSATGALVGACPAATHQHFASYSLAVVLLR